MERRSRPTSSSAPGGSPVVRPVLARRARLAAPQRQGSRRRSREAARAHRGQPTCMPRADSTVQVPVRLLEHYALPAARSRARARRRPGRRQARRRAREPRATGQGEGRRAATTRAAIQFVLELKIDDIVDWLWEEMKLPEPEGQDAARCARDDCDARRLGPARRALAARPAPLVEGSDQAAWRSSRTRPRSPTTICAIGSSRCASSRRPRPSCSS